MSFADIVAVMPPATWYELPNTKMSAVYAITDPGDPRYGVSGPKSVVLDFSGAAFDSDNNRFFVHGGGHNSYGGNEVYQFDLITLAWIAATTPSTYIEDPENPGGSYFLTTDGTPVSVHTYDGMQYIPGLNKFFKFGGAMWSSGNAGDSYAYLFDTVNHSWERKAKAPVDDLTPATAYDASRHCIWVLVKTGGLLRYNITADTWDTIVGVPNLQDQVHRVMAYDPVNDRLLIIGSEATAPAVAYYDCTVTGGTLQTVTVTGESIPLFRPGLAYDPTRAQFVLWSGFGSVYAVDPQTWVATKINAGTGDTPAPPTGLNGIFSHWQYVPDHDCFLGYINPAGNMWVYKAGTAGSGPAPGWGDPQRVVAVTPATGKVTGSHTGFNALLVRNSLPDEMFDPSGSFAAQVNGGDIRITADLAGTIRLPIDLRPGFALDSVTGDKTGKCELWTKLPSLDQTTPVYVWYHSASAQVQPLNTEPFGRNEVWSTLIAGWHLSSIGTIEDITGGGGDLSVTSAGGTVTGPYVEAGLNVTFNSSVNSPVLDLDQDYTISVMIQRPASMSGGKLVAAFFGAADTANAFTLRSNTGTTLVFRLLDEAGVATDIVGSAGFPEDVWRRFTLVSKAGSGEQSAYSGTTTLTTTTAVRRVGAGHVNLNAAAANIYWAKVFIAKGLATPEQVTTEAANQTDPDTFWVAGTPIAPATSVSAAIAWRIAAAPTQVAAQAIAWGIELQRAITAIAWRISLQSVGRTVAWKILSPSTARAIAWRIRTQASRPITWVIKSQASRPITWKIQAQTSRAISWAIRTGGTPAAYVVAMQTAWRVGTRWFKVTRS